MNLLTVSCNLFIVVLVLAFGLAVLYENVGAATQQVVEQVQATLAQGQQIAERAVEVKQDITLSLSNLPKIAAMKDIKITVEPQEAAAAPPPAAGDAAGKLLKDQEGKCTLALQHKRLACDATIKPVAGSDLTCVTLHTAWISQAKNFCTYLCEKHPQDSQVYASTGESYCKETEEANLSFNQLLACAVFFGRTNSCKFEAGA